MRQEQNMNIQEHPALKIIGDEAGSHGTYREDDDADLLSSTTATFLGTL